MRRLMICLGVLLLASPAVLADYVLTSNDGWVRRFTDDFATQLWSASAANAPSAVLFGPDGNIYVSRLTAGVVERYNYETGALIGAVVPDVGSTVNAVGGGTVTLQSGGSHNVEAMTFGDIGGPAGFGLAHTDGVPDLIINRRDKIEIYDGASLDKAGTGSETWGTLLFQKYRADTAGNTEDGTGGQGIVFGPNYGLPNLYVMKGVNTATSGVYEGRFHIYDLSSPTLEDTAYPSGQGQRDSGTIILGPDVNGDGQNDLWSIDNRNHRINAYNPITGDRIVTSIPIVNSLGVAAPSGGLRFPTNIAPGPDGSILVTTRFRTWLDPSWTGSEQAGGNLLQLVWDKTNLRAVATLLYESPNDTGRLDGVLYIGLNLTVARDPSPSNGATDVIRDTLLGWTAGLYAATHDVYLGTSSSDVEAAGRTNPMNVLSKQDHDTDTYDPGRLEFGQTYYWRVDEVNAPPGSTVFKGDVWSFTVEPVAYPIPGERIAATASSQVPDQGPQKTIDGSGLVDGLHSIGLADMWLSSDSDAGPVWVQYEFDKAYKLHEMWVWNYNGPSLLAMIGVKNVVIEYSTDGVQWTRIDGVAEFARATGQEGYAASTIVALDGVAAKSVKITASSNWSSGVFNQYGLSEVRFMAIPVSAREPNPGSASSDVTIDATLGWRAGRQAGEHKVYLSLDEQAVIAGTAPVTTATGASYGPLSLDLDSTYYWRVDEVNGVDTWQRNVWSFTTQAYRVVDDFESYNDTDPPDPESHRIFEIWKDGYGTTINGALVGNELPPYTDRARVHGGRQSVPVIYNNGVASLSEVTANTSNLAIGRDWSKGGAQRLSLWFYGDPNNAAERMYVKVNNAKAIYEGNLTTATWQEWVIDLATLGVSLSDVTTLTIGFERAGAVGGTGKVLLDDLRLYPPPPPAVPVVALTDASFKNSFNQYWR